MKDKFFSYLRSIGMGEPLIERVTHFYLIYENLYPESIKAIFVTDYIESGDMRNFENLWFFSSKYAMEAKNFATEDVFDLTPIENIISYWEIKKENYDFQHATDQSRATLFFKMKNRVEGNLKAAKNNCDQLKKIFLKYIKPNIYV